MKKEININLKISTEKFKNTDIYFVKIRSNSNFIENQEFFTNSNGVNLLNAGYIGTEKIKKLNYILLSKDEVEQFRNMNFHEIKLLDKKNNMERIKDKNYDLYEIDYSSHYVYNLKKELIPLYINLDNPLYLINNKEFNLEEILTLIKENKNFKSNLNEEIVISKIPYYNAESNKNKYLNIGYAPTNEDWTILMNLVEKYNLKNKKTNYIPYLSNILLESGILGFKPNKNIILKDKK